MKRGVILRIPTESKNIIGYLGVSRRILKERKIDVVLPDIPSKFKRRI